MRRHLITKNFKRRYLNNYVKVFSNTEVFKYKVLLKNIILHTYSLKIFKHYCIAVFQALQTSLFLTKCQIRTKRLKIYEKTGISMSFMGIDFSTLAHQFEPATGVFVFFRTH